MGEWLACAHFILNGRAKGNSRQLRVSFWARDRNVQKFGEEEYQTSMIFGDNCIVM